MKPIWHWIVTAAAAAVLLWAGEPVLAQGHGGYGGRGFGGGGYGVGYGGYGGPRGFGGGYGGYVGYGGGFYGGYGGAGGYGGSILGGPRFVGSFNNFYGAGSGYGGYGASGGAFVGRRFGGQFRASPLIYPTLYGLYAPWYANPGFWPYYFPEPNISGPPSGYNSPGPSSSDLADNRDHFAPTYAVLYTAPAITVSPSGVGDSAARLDLIVPSDAEVWIEGVQTKQTGGFRRFVSPPLEPGTRYAYDVHARWSRDGQVMDQVHQVTVRAGDLVRIDFLKPLDLLASASDVVARQGPLNEKGSSALARAARPARVAR
jgi:uncharacterized protein (TIGR03000 family)